VTGDPTKATITWTPGTGGVSQLYRVDESLDEVLNGCPTPGACEAAGSVSTTTTSQNIQNLNPQEGTIYYARIVTYSDSTCYKDAVVSYSVPCDDTPPTNLSVSNITTNTATISWTPGTGGASQLIRVDEDLWEVQNGCPTPRDCEAAATLLTTVSSEIVSGLLPLTTYYARIVTYSDSACYVDAITSFTTLNNAVIG
jgi:hypothetical protein